MLKSVFWAFVFWGCLGFTNVHKFYVATTQLLYLPKKESMQVVQRVFTDDLEKELRNELGSTIEIGTKRTPKNIKEIYQNHLDTHLRFTINGKMHPIKLLKAKQEGDQTVFYIVLNQLKNIHTFSLQNTLLINTFDEQKHIVTTKIKGVKRSFVLNRRQIKAKIL